jgi:hypothetical protein
MMFTGHFYFALRFRAPQPTSVNRLALFHFLHRRNSPNQTMR